jgi:hypothetical protein
MIESIPTTWNDKRDAAFFEITEALAADGFADEIALLVTAVFTGADLVVQIEKMLEDLVVAESWESTVIRFVAHSKPHRRDLVPVPVAARRRGA